MVKTISVTIEIANAPRLLNAALGCRRIKKPWKRPPGLKICVRGRIGGIEVANAVRHVRVLASDIANRQGGLARQLVLNIEAPLPDIAVFVVRLNVQYVH